RPRGTIGPARTLCRIQSVVRPRHHLRPEDRRQCRFDPVVDAAGGEVAVKTTMPLPRAMLIDMDDTILSAYGRPDIAWNKIAAEFAAELAPLPPQQVAAAILTFARQFWATADAAWRLKLTEARQLTVKGGFAALGAAHRTILSDDLAVRLADRFTIFREEEAFV